MSANDSVGEPTARVPCDVCGRPPGRGGCEKDCASDTVNGYTGVVHCLEIGYEREKRRADIEVGARNDQWDRRKLAEARAFKAEAFNETLKTALRAAREYVFGDHGAPSLRDQIDAALGEP